MSRVIYKLTKLDMSSVGHMGSSPTLVWEKMFSQLGYAKGSASQDWGTPVIWEFTKPAYWTSGDLLTTMYEIKKIAVTQ